MAGPLITRDRVRDVLPFEQTVPDDVLDRYIQETHARLVLELGFDYETDIQVRTIDTTANTLLTLPGAGAYSIISVVEDGTTLATSAYELDPDNGRFVLRLDTDGLPRDWYAGRRSVVVTYLPARPSPALAAAELVETVRAYRGAQAGYADRIGVDGTNVVPYSHAFSADTRRLIEALKRGGGVGVW